MLRRRACVCERVLAHSVVDGTIGPCFEWTNLCHRGLRRRLKTNKTRRINSLEVEKKTKTKGYQYISIINFSLVPLLRLKSRLVNPTFFFSFFLSSPSKFLHCLYCFLCDVNFAFLFHSSVCLIELVSAL